MTSSPSPSHYDRDQDPAPTVRARTLRTHTARRKTHMCDNCGEPILLGQRYTREFAIVDGVPEIIRKHVAGQCLIKDPE